MKTKAQKYYDQFEVIKIDNDTSRVVFKKRHDEALYKSVMNAHGGTLPNDFIFETYHNILGSIADSDCKTIDEIEDARPEIIDSFVDIYTSCLTNWLNSSSYNMEYLDEAIGNGAKNGSDALMQAQYLAIEEIFNEVVTLLEK